jgi:hypothetical protein
MNRDQQNQLVTIINTMLPTGQDQHILGQLWSHELRKSDAHGAAYLSRRLSALTTEQLRKVETSGEHAAL